MKQKKFEKSERKNYWIVNIFIIFEILQTWCHYIKNSQKCRIEKFPKKIWNKILRKKNFEKNESFKQENNLEKTKICKWKKKQNIFRDFSIRKQSKIPFAKTTYNMIFPKVWKSKCHNN